MQRILLYVKGAFRCVFAGMILLSAPSGWAVSATPPPLMQERIVTGRVTSADDQQGFPGANIIVKGTTIGTVADGDGNFSIRVSSDESILVFTAIGYASAERVVGTQSVINIAMETDVTTLSEVVVVGYGTVKKSDVTGALTRVSAETIQERPAQNVVQALQGKAAGMNVSSNIRPGELPAVTIRGNRSINASNAPLYVVDGIPLISPPVSLITNPNTIDTPPFLNDINPNDIASVEILKDASATAIYGSRGANGVILITTKKGAKGKVSVNYNTTVSLDSYKSLTDWMSGGEYFDRWRLSLMNGRSYQPTTNTNFNDPADIWYPDPELDRLKMGLTADTRALEALKKGYEWVDYDAGVVEMRPTTAAEKELGWPDEVPVYNSENIPSYNWKKDAVRQGVTQNHQISISSGTETSRLYLSLGYFNQTGVQRDQDYKRYNALISGDISPTKWFTLGTSINTSFSLQNFGISTNIVNTGSKDLYSRASDQFPFLTPTDDQGEYIRNPQLNINLFNPLLDIDQSVNERRATSVLGSLFAEVKFTPWLKYRVNFGSQYRDFRRGAWTGPLATSHLGARPNTTSYADEETFSWLTENLLYFDKTFSNVHTIGVTLLQSAQKFRREGSNVGVSGMINPLAYWYDVGANTNGRADTYGTSFTENTLMSYMARVNYTLKDKYLLTASGRFDGSSVLAPGNKWDFFPSFAVAWKLHEETFMNNLPWIDELKPRISYGVVGNSAIEPYTSSGPLSRNMYVFATTSGTAVPAPGYLPQLVRNPDLRWEKTAEWNLGLDFSILKSQLTGSVELYQASTRDLIFGRTLAAPSGYVEKLENIGKTRNKGIEITLSAVALERPSFSWNIDVNWAANREEIVELINGKEDMLANRLFIGQPTQVYYQYDHDGIWQNTTEDLEELAEFKANGFNFYPGTVKVVDQNGDYKITADDFVVRGTNRPKWTGGITNTFQYKNWTLSAFVYARIGQTFFGGYPNSYGGIFPNGRVENDVWSWDNPGGRWPMPNAGSGVANYTAAMQFNDGSFVSVRNISLSYSFPQAWISKMFLKNLDLNFQILNPFLFGGEVVKMGINPDDVTNWDGISSANGPTSSPLGGMNNNTILPQSLVFGVRAGF